MSAIKTIITTRKLLLLIFLLGLSVRMFLVWKQQNAHVDNFWSFQIASGNWGKDLPEDKWLHYRDFFRLFFVNRSSSTNYQMVKESTAKDIHPPLYYYLLHWVMVLNNGQPHVNLLYLLGFIFYSISFVMLYKLSFLILKSYPKILFTLLLFSLSFGALSGFLGLRMYMLQTPLIMGLIYLFFLQKEKKTLTIYDYIAFGVLVFLASYTNYNSLIATFLLSLVIAFHYWFVDRNLDRIKGYLYTLAATATVYIAVFPNIFGQIRTGMDVRDSIGRILTIIYWSKLADTWRFIQDQLFYGVLFIVLIYILGYTLYKSIKKKQSIKSRLFDPIKFDSDSINIFYVFLFTIPLSIFILQMHLHDRMIRYIYFLSPYFFIWMASYLPTFKKGVVIIATSILFIIHSLSSILNINYQEQNTSLNRNLPIHHLYWDNPMHDVYEKNLYILVKRVDWETGPIQYNAREKSLLYVSRKLKWDIIKSKDSVAVFVADDVDNKLKDELIENSYKKIGTYDSDIFISFDIFVKR